MISSAEIGPDGEVRLIRPLADQRFLEPNSGIYFQISGKGFDDFRSRSLWDRALQADDEHQDLRPHVYDSKQFPGEPLRLMERTRSEEQTSELQSLMRISYAVFCLKKNKQ